jgi:N-acetylneuraminate lyase
MKKQFLSGFIAAPFTPLTASGEVNLKPIRQYAQHLISSNVSGAFVCGTTGEGLSLTTEERKKVLEEWVICSEDKLKVICHVGGNCLPQSIDLASHAQKNGADAIAAFSPSFFKPGNAGELVSFMEPIASSAPSIPFYFYHFPALTGVSMPVIDILAEAEKRIPSFTGVKYTHFDMYDMQLSIAFGKGKYEILHGHDEMLLCGLSLGVKSAVGSTYNYVPALYHKLLAAFNKGDMELAREYQQISVKIVSVLIRYGGGVRAGKAIMELTGIDCGQCRLPIRSMTDAEKASMKKELTETGFFDFIS